MALRARRILLGVAAVAVIAVASLALLLRSLQDGDLRAGVEARLSASLGQPVSIGRIGVSLFPPSLSGTDVRVGEARVLRSSGFEHMDQATLDEEMFI